MNLHSKFLSTAVSVFAILLFSGVSAFACSCVAPPTVDIAFDRTPTVAIFSVESVSEPSKEGETWSERAVLIVEKGFKGKLKRGERFTFSNQGPCAVDFQRPDVGRKYLLYLSARPSGDEVWWAAMCSRAGPLSSTADDVLYLEKRNKVLGKTRLSGMVSQQAEEDEDPGDWYFKNLPGHVLTVRGKGKEITLKTDDNGAYEIYGLAPGKYEITLTQISGFSPNNGDDPLEPTIVTIAAKKHTEKNFYYNIYNSVSGTLLDSEQQPIAGVCLALRSANFKIPSYGEKGACTDIRGQFSFSNLLSGNYVLLGNKDNKISSREPYPRFFYPGVPDESGATTFAMAPGIHFTKIVVSAPPTTEVVTLTGTVRFSDGIPPAKAKIEFFSGISSKAEIKDPLSYSSWAETDETGAFRLRVRKGETGIAIASFTAHKNGYKDCPQVLKIIEKGALAWDDIESTPVTINAGDQDALIELKYPFASCKMGK